MLLDLVPTTSTIAINIPHKSIYIYIYTSILRKKFPLPYIEKETLKAWLAFSVSLKKCRNKKPPSLPQRERPF